MPFIKTYSFPYFCLYVKKSSTQKQLSVTFLKFGCIHLLLLAAFFKSNAQDFEWWNNKHNWDGVTHWSRYIILSPKFLGPNALPVPQIKNGLLNNEFTLQLAAENHQSKGDKTSNIFTRLNIPLQKNKVALSIKYVPIEYYSLDTITRDERRARHLDAKGFATGDVYFGTQIQLVKNHEKLPDLLISINLRTASGSKLSDARYTDTPGYYFDISGGKTYLLNKKQLKSIRPFAMLGFYVWQTFRQDYYQDDALLYGLGCNLNFENFTLTNAFGGYRGYIGNGDNPNVYRLTLTSALKSKVNYVIRFQQGLSDFNYSTFRLGCNINLGYKK